MHRLTGGASRDMNFYNAHLDLTGHENDITQPEADECPSSTSHYSPFNRCLSVVF